MKNNDRSDFKPIYIHWYEDEFQADLVVRRMSSRQRAFFRNLLMYCYFGKERPYLTTDDDLLWLIADADSKEEWLANKQPILAKFTVTVRKDGQRLLANKRVLEEWQIIEGWLTQKQKAGLASAAARRRENGHSNDPEPGLIVHPATTVPPPSNNPTLAQNSLSTSELGTNPALAPTPVQQPVDSLLTGSQEPPKSFSTYEDVDGDGDGDGEGEGDVHADGDKEEKSQNLSLSLSTPVHKAENENQEENNQKKNLSDLIGKKNKGEYPLDDKPRADLVVALALSVNPKAAGFYEKAKGGIVRAIKETFPTEAELGTCVRAIVEPMDDFSLTNAGSAIAGSLAGHILALRQRKAEAERQAASLPPLEEYPPSADGPDAEELFDLAVTVATFINQKAVFNAKSKGEIVRIIKQTSPTKEELGRAVEGIVKQLDDFSLWNAGSAIAASLAGWLKLERKTKEIADRNAARHEQEMRIVEEDIARHKQKLDEAVAKDKEETEGLRIHHPDDCFCACPQCQPDFWADRAAASA